MSFPPNLKKSWFYESFLKISERIVAFVIISNVNAERLSKMAEKYTFI